VTKHSKKNGRSRDQPTPRLRPCSRCGHQARSLAAMADWNVIGERGYIIGLICGDCQTAEENAEAAIHEATLDYTVINGRLAGRPKGMGR
jgi:transcription elongation factor Elf1